MASVLVALTMLLTSLAAWSGLAWLVATIPPGQSLALVAFYLFAFTGLSATAALAAWLALRQRQPAGRLRSPTGYLGHAMLFAAIVLFALWLQSLRMLTPVAAALLLGLYLFLELALLFGTRGAVDLNVPSRTALGSAEP